jgi:dihydroorotate dehydrogenase electron transfer subunit
MPYLGEVLVVGRREVAARMYELLLQCPAVAERSLPGQFVQVRAWPKPGAGADPLLDRPFSVAGVDRRRGEFRLLVRVVGRGTERLTAVRPGQTLRVTGPLGRGFPVRAEQELVFLVGGGAGVAPLLFVAEELAAHGRRDVRFLAGARTAAEAPGAVLPDWTEWATDDGSEGYKGTVVSLLERALEEGGITVGRQSGRGGALPVVYACGPAPMLRAVQALAAERALRAYLSLEERMACGVGACRGCAVRLADRTGREAGGEEITVTGYARVCHDGPVFEAGEVVLDA